MAAGTYARRNGLSALLGIAGAKDDDGQSATPPDELPEPLKPKPQPRKPEPPQQPVVVATIEETFDATPKQAAASYEATQLTVEEKWVKQAISGFPLHKHMGEHNKWSNTNTETLQTLKTTKPEIYQKLLGAWKARKLELEGKN